MAGTSTSATFFGIPESAGHLANQIQVLRSSDSSRLEEEPCVGQYCRPDLVNSDGKIRHYVGRAEHLENSLPVHENCERVKTTYWVSFWSVPNQENSRGYATTLFGDTDSVNV